MEQSHEIQTKTSVPDCSPLLTLGGRVSQGTTLTVLAVATVGAAVVLGWDSLVALGLSTFILALLPCAAMCALGICASRMGRRDAGAATEAVPPKEPLPPAAENAADAKTSAAEKIGAPAP
ncbi:MAG: hypothetical protein HYX46_12665 [Betaproteobacteria bacterium]|nr:hypothetical protein [Betaproteobacteria bacterium]